MKKSNHILVILLLLFYSFPVLCQTIESANANYRQFISLRSSGGNENSMYSALYRSYQDYSDVLKSSKVNSSEYVQAKNSLKELYPLMQNAASYCSSHGNQKNALLFAQAFMDIPLMPEFKEESFARGDYFSTMAYFAASGTYNNGDYNRAIEYFKVFLSTGEQNNRKNVYMFMTKACMSVHNYSLAMSVLNEACNNYPNDFQLLSVAINTCIECEDNVNLQKYVTKALAIKPNDNTLLNIQGKLYEDTNEYQKALNIYNQMLRSNPNSLTVNRHLAINYYNLGVLNYSKAAVESDQAASNRYSRQANEYFTAAAGVMEKIVESDPSSVKYTQALAVAYNCIGNTTKLESANHRLSMMGSSTIDSGYILSLINYSDNSTKDVASVVNNFNSNTSSVQTSPESESLTANDDIPRFSEFAKTYIETRLKKWQAKDPYETVAEYQERVNESTRNAEVEKLKKSAEEDYIKTYTKNIRFNDMTLKPYDAENRVFLIESKYGELIIPVPRENNKAKFFESGWNGMQFRNPQFYINNDQLMLSNLTFITPSGDTYSFEGDKNLDYIETVVDVSFEEIGNEAFAYNDNKSKESRVKRQSVKVGTVISDVDEDIPVVNVKNEKTFAVIIANENYSMVSSVPMALNDGTSFSKYCSSTLGLPENNIRLYKDASFGVMIRAMRDIKDIANAYSGDIQVIFYYAGHGIPNEATKDAYLLPIDADGMQTEGCYSLNRLYGELGNLQAKSVVVFLDACFSGAKRDGEMLASARGVALKPKEEAPKGNMVIFSAASGNETAFPFEEKGHGLFTYYLLKKLKETKGDVNLQDLGNYIVENVKQRSVVVNHKSQTPTVNASGTLAENWQKIKLNGK